MTTALKTKLYRVASGEDRYECFNFVMQREYGETPNGNQLGGSWVLRDRHGELIGWDRNRHDLAERNDIELG